MTLLSHADLSAIVEGDLAKIEMVDLSNRRLGEIEDLAICKALKRIELGNNQLESLECLQYNFELKWIDAKQNNLHGHFGNILRNLSNLTVLNLSHNKITNVDNLMDGLAELKSLVLSDNRITSIRGIAKLQNLETLILSNNPLENFEMPKRPMQHLKKLSLGNNRIKTFLLDETVFNLRELRLNGNRLTDLPANMYYCGQLEILDLGKNCITVRNGMTPGQYCSTLLRRCKKLKSLNLAGNVGLATTPEEWDKICDEIRKEIPTLQIFNSRNFSTVKCKRKRQERNYRERSGVQKIGKSTHEVTEMKMKIKKKRNGLE